LRRLCAEFDAEPPRPDATARHLAMSGCSGAEIFASSDAGLQFGWRLRDKWRRRPALLPRKA
jgi:hypothetical protein